MAGETSLSVEEVEVTAPIDAQFFTVDSDPSDQIQGVCSTVGDRIHCT
jgi:hypothetical protein